MKMLRNSVKNWLFVDTRTLALFRLVFGFMGLLDVIRRYPFIDVFYSSEGMDFRRYAANKYSIKYFSLLDHIHSSDAVQAFFIFTIICFILFIVGYRTRFFQFLATMGLISIHNAAIILENGADLVYNSFLIWALFLPLGASWSIDSIRKSLKVNKEYDSNDLNTSNPSFSKKIFHMGYVACLVQLSMIYFYNHVNKTGTMWIDGTAIHYMYELDTFITLTGEWMKALLGIEIIKLLTWSTTWLEMLAPIAILSPIFQPWLRRGAFLVLSVFHIMIALSINVAMFSWVMLAVITLLLGTQEIDFLRALFSRFKGRKLVVFYDRDCGFCHLSARILKRMDVYSRFLWSDRLEKDSKPEGLESLLERTIVVWDKDTGKVWTRHEGFSKLISALPFGFLVGWILRVPILEKIFGFIYDLVAKNRTSISKAMGLPACGLSNEKPGRDRVSIKNEKKVFTIGRKTIWIVSNIVALSLLIGAVDYSTRINEGFKKPSTKDKVKIKSDIQNQKFKKARKGMKRVLLYPRMYQEWNMFSPKVLMNETWLLADVTFENGEILTLFQNDVNIEKKFNRVYFKPYAMQFWRKLFERLGRKNYQKHIPKFKKWLKETDFFEDEYDGRKVEYIKLWRLSERSPDPDTPLHQVRSVVKRELKKRDYGRNKKSGLVKKRTGKNILKK